MSRLPKAFEVYSSTPVVEELLLKISIGWTPVPSAHCPIEGFGCPWKPPGCTRRNSSGPVAWFTAGPGQPSSGPGVVP